MVSLTYSRELKTVNTWRLRTMTSVVPPRLKVSLEIRVAAELPAPEPPPTPAIVEAAPMGETLPAETPAEPVETPTEVDAPVTVDDTADPGPDVVARFAIQDPKVRQGKFDPTRDAGTVFLRRGDDDKTWTTSLVHDPRFTSQVFQLLEAPSNMVATLKLAGFRL